MSRKKMILKLLTVIVGTVIAAFGLDIAIYAGFGSATLAVLWQGMAKTIRITIGQASLIIASAMVVFCWFYDRKQIHIGTILYQVIYSFCIDLFAPFLHYSSSKLANFLIMIETLMTDIQALVQENARKSQDQQKYREKFNKLVERIDKQKALIADLKAEELKMVGMREKLNRFIEALARCEGVMEFTEQDWGDLVECVVVKPDTLTFEFKDNSKIEVAIQP